MSNAPRNGEFDLELLRRQMNNKNNNNVLYEHMLKIPKNHSTKHLSIELHMTEGFSPKANIFC